MSSLLQVETEQYSSKGDNRQDDHTEEHQHHPRGRQISAKTL